jgi:hypothetical protein
VGVIHFTGLPVYIGQRVRQRCAWCGIVLEDEDLSQLMHPDGSSPWQPWKMGVLLLVEGNGRSIVAVCASLPSGTCADQDLRPFVRTLRLVPT